MDQNALAEQMWSLYLSCKQAGKRFLGEEPSEAQIGLIFTRADHHIISDNIQKKLSAGQKPSSEKPKSDTNCRDCGRPLTVGEKKYCDDNDTSYKCYQCSHK